VADSAISVDAKPGAGAHHAGGDPKQTAGPGGRTTATASRHQPRGAPHVQLAKPPALHRRWSPRVRGGLASSARFYCWASPLFRRAPDLPSVRSLPRPRLPRAPARKPVSLVPTRLPQRLFFFAGHGVPHTRNHRPRRAHALRAPATTRIAPRAPVFETLPPLPRLFIPPQAPTSPSPHSTHIPSHPIPAAAPFPSAAPLRLLPPSPGPRNGAAPSRPRGPPPGLVASVGALARAGARAPASAPARARGGVRAPSRPAAPAAARARAARGWGVVLGPRHLLRRRRRVRHHGYVSASLIQDFPHLPVLEPRLHLLPLPMVLKISILIPSLQEGRAGTGTCTARGTAPTPRR
jgi:hypothetical protein